MAWTEEEGGGEGGKAAFLAAFPPGSGCWLQPLL